MNSLFCNRLYSGSLVCPRITSSMSVWANFFGLILCSCDAPSRSYRNATSSLSTSMNSTIPRLAMFSSPSKLKARGSESLPYSAILLAEDQAFHLDVIDRLLPIAVVLIEQVGVDLAAEGADVAVEPDALVF